ncbi:indolepyruvate ferredoxin oxidoreductase beta subunit [Sporobacter termitidis DSM 10068]|uniref:Indolepyruvate ferredoxin oxidoreductase beta subunit n=1 Tax=Sporobacter termitidis DSM 10068 TaxID=1123282 RepID=A0A1M5TE46_9FIRM|nr:indolepyruvate oxidoreductase subunit beta [Sporobacter termitidis]SHH48999.1 indolepyruvate ferredoxin oxidoreductase beta subunit [Sporobacter termitidis DSM 10068]
MNILLAGVGGQGTVLASRLLAQCGLDKGLRAHTAETIGMAQRGGSVVSHVRIGEDMFSPLIPKGTADIIIGFEPAEAVRCFDYLKPGGAVVVSSRPIRPTTAILSGSAYDGGAMLDFLKSSAGRLVVVDGERLAEETGSMRSLNLALLGAAAGSALGFTTDDIAGAMAKLMAPRHIEANMTALRLGFESVKNS